MARNLGGGRLEVHTADGRKLAVHRNYLTVTAAPGGKKPSGNPADRPRPQRAGKPSKDVEEFTPSGQDTRVPVSELRPGQLAYVHGWDQYGDSTSNLGRVSGVSPAGPPKDADTRPGSGWAVSFVDNTNRHWTMFTTDDAVARVVPGEDFARLVEAERDNDQEQADRIAREIRDQVNAIDDAEASPQTPASPAVEVPAVGSRVRLSNGAEGTVARTREDGALAVRLDSGSQISTNTSDVETLDAPAPTENGGRPELAARQWITTPAFNDPVRIEQIQDTLTGVEVEVVTIRGDRRTLAEEELGDWQPADEPPNHRADGAPVTPQTRPQEGLFADMGTDKDGNRDIFMELDDEDDQPTPTAEASAVPDTAEGNAAVESAAGEMSAQERILDAYTRTAPGPGRWAGLAELRSLLGDMPRAEQDQALRELERLPYANLVPESNQKTLTADDRAAAVTLGGQDKHLIAVYTERPETGQWIRPRGADPVRVESVEDTYDGPAATVMNADGETSRLEGWNLFGWQAADAPEQPTRDQQTSGQPEATTEPDGISPARQRQLAELIEEQAARYVPTGDPGRYLSEVAGDQGVPRPGERAWIDAYLRDHPEVLTATGEERAARQQERAQQQEADRARAKTLSLNARAAFDEGRFDEALQLLDQAEEADPNGRNWDRVREKIRQGQVAAAAAAAQPNPEPAPPPAEAAPEQQGRVVRGVRWGHAWEVDGVRSGVNFATPEEAQEGLDRYLAYQNDPPERGLARLDRSAGGDGPLERGDVVDIPRWDIYGGTVEAIRDGGITNPSAPQPTAMTEIEVRRADGKTVRARVRESSLVLRYLPDDARAHHDARMAPIIAQERAMAEENLAAMRADRERQQARQPWDGTSEITEGNIRHGAERIGLADANVEAALAGYRKAPGRVRTDATKFDQHIASEGQEFAEQGLMAAHALADAAPLHAEGATGPSLATMMVSLGRAFNERDVNTEFLAGRDRARRLMDGDTDALDGSTDREREGAAAYLAHYAKAVSRAQGADGDTARERARRAQQQFDAYQPQAEQPSVDTPREAAPEGQAYADEIQMGDTLAETQWRMAGPEAGALRAGESAYANPAGPARLGEPIRDSRRVTDIQQEPGGRLTFTFDDGTRISRRPDALVTRGTPADVEGGEDIPQANAQVGDRIQFDTAGPKLPAGLDREALGIGRFDRVTVTGKVSRRQPGMPSVVLDDVTITRADGTAVSAPSGTRFTVPRRVTRLDDSEPTPQPEQVPSAALRDGDRIVGPTGDVAVERVEQLDDGLVTAVVRDAEDRRERHLIAADRPVRLAPVQDEDSVDEVEASGLAVGEWVLIDDVPMQVASPPEVDDGRARFDVRDQDGRLSEVELDERLLLPRFTGTPSSEAAVPAAPAAEPERVTATDLPDGTPTGRVRLRTDQRRRLLDLNLDATNSGASPEVAQAAARLRARRELSAEQMQALAAHLRTLAADESTPAPRRRALARTAGWVEAANAKLEGFPPPPHDPGRPAPERAYARNLAMGDVIALPGEDGTVRFGTVTATRPVRGFGLHTVHVRHEDGSVEQRVLPDGVDVWLMPDLPPDLPTSLADFTREHVTADRIDVGDLIRWDGSDFADPVVGQVLSVERRGGEFAAVRLYEMTVLDGDDEQRTITITDQGWPSVERMGRGPATSDQPYDSLMQPETAEYVGWRDLRVGDRATVMMATGTITGITRHPTGDDVPAGATVQIMADSGEQRSVSVFDDPDMPDDYVDPSVMRLIPADDNAAARIAAVRRERERIAREREFTAFLADLETTRSRWAATDIAQVARELPASASREEALAAAMERLDRIDTMDDTAAATLAFRLGARDNTQTAAMAPATSAVTQAVKARATSRIRAALEGTDLLGGETWPRALARVAAAYRDHPPAPGVLPAGVSLARLRERIQGQPEQPAPRMADMPQDADLPGRLAAYRAQLPDDLANVGRQPVMRTVFEPTTLEDLEAGRVPAVRQAMLWAPDVADDDGPGPEAMRQLAVLRAAGADLDVRFRSHLAGRDVALGAELDAVTRERGQAWKAADELDAEIARIRSEGGTPDAGLLGQRDDAAARWQAAAVREQELRRMLAEARREALAATLAEVRQVGGDGLDYIDRNGRPLTGRAGSNAAALRFVEEVLPSDWLQAARESGPVEVVTGPGQHVHVRADGSTRISLPADDNTEIAPAIREGQPGRVPVPSAQPGGVAKATVAAHELGHHLEATVPGLRAAGQAMLWDRTSHGPIGDRVRPEPMYGEDRGRPFEIHPGDFPDARTGRVNGDGTQEVFANVLESLAGGGDYADDDLRHWGLGVLALLATDATGPQGGVRRDEGAERRDPLDGINLLALSDEQLRALLARIGDPQAVARLRAVLDEREQRRTGQDEIDLADLSDAELESMLLAGWDGYGDDPAKTALQDRVIAETEAREAERRRRGDELGDLAASDLLSMDADDLAALYGRNLGRYGMDPAVTALLDQISAELEERDRRRDIGADPYAGIDLAGMSEEQLAELIERHQPLYHSDPWSGALVRRIIAELDDRDRQRGAEDDRTPEEMRIDDLITQGWNPRDAYAEVYGLSEEEMDRQERIAIIDAERGTGERREQVVRRMYRQWVYEQALEAERATNGYMLSPLGRKAGKDPKDLWGGNADHAYAYASEELKRWWADQPNGGRMTYEEWRAQWLGDSRDRRQAQERRQTAGNGRDFG
ncbi:hypothetical protein [Nonomuraea sp. NPDC050202]|uniref:hypothetical protein n=1 Tax=Nonomuraea sp. NPDC050202 TaxID=3155035 RepID=UPI0033D63AB5